MKETKDRSATVCNPPWRWPEQKKFTDALAGLQSAVSAENGTNKPCIWYLKIQRIKENKFGPRKRGLG